MKVRHKEKGYLGTASKFNILALAEIIVGLDMGDMDTMYIRDFDVLLELDKDDPEWKDMSQAFRDKDLITDNYNEWFFEPKTEEDRVRGFV